MNYSNYVDVNSAILAGFDYHENQVGFKFEKWTMERKTFWFFLEMNKQLFPYLKKKQKNIPGSLALEKLWHFLTSACNSIITLVIKSQNCLIMLLKCTD